MGLTFGTQNTCQLADSDLCRILAQFFGHLVGAWSGFSVNLCTLGTVFPAPCGHLAQFSGYFWRPCGVLGVALGGFGGDFWHPEYTPLSMSQTCADTWHSFSGTLWTLGTVSGTLWTLGTVFGLLLAPFWRFGGDFSRSKLACLRLVQTLGTVFRATFCARFALGGAFFLSRLHI